MQTRPRNPLPADALLVVVVASLLATVAAVWLMVTILEGWAVVLALVIAVTGVLALMTVMSRELDESDDDSEPPSDQTTAPEPTATGREGELVRHYLV